MLENNLIRDMAIVERPRERLQKLGVEALKDEELLALVIRTGFRGHGAVDVAREALARYSLKQLLELPFAQLQRIRGLGVSKSASLLAGAELARRAQTESPLAIPKIQNIQDVIAQAMDIRDKKKEYLLAFFLNARQQLITREIISIGTLTASLAHPREIFAPAIGKAAAGVILVHNHPSGDPSPSEDDIRLTQRIRQAGHILGIELLDHLIVAEKGSYSFKTSGGL
jgi:DNA repair protein RadC